MADFPPDWTAFIALLNRHRVRFLIVGAHALAANGRPRATQDLDIFVEPTRLNATRIARALSAFGFEALARESARFGELNRMATLGREPLRIDVMTSISGVTFQRAWRGRIRSQVGRNKVSFLGKKELLANKRASGRTKDLLDIELLAEVDVPKRKPTRRNKSRGQP